MVGRLCEGRTTFAQARFRVGSVSDGGNIQGLPRSAATLGSSHNNVIYPFGVEHNFTSIPQGSREARQP